MTSRRGISEEGKSYLKRRFPRLYGWFKKTGLVEAKIWDILAARNARGLPDFDPDRPGWPKSSAGRRTP